MKIEVLLRSLKLVSLGDLTSFGFISDVPFYRSPGGRFAIPGSSIKGVLRTLATNLAKEYGLSAIDTINPSILQSSNNDVALLFGKPGLSLPVVRISTFYPVDNVEPVVLTRIKINEKTGRVEERALFEVEYLPPCTVFSGRIYLNVGLLERQCNNANKVEKLVTLFFKALKFLRFNRLGRGDSVYDVKVVNVDDLEKELSARGFSDKVLFDTLSSLREFFWKVDLCGERV